MFIYSTNTFFINSNSQTNCETHKLEYNLCFNKKQTYYHQHEKNKQIKNYAFFCELTYTTIKARKKIHFVGKTILLQSNCEIKITGHLQQRDQQTTTHRKKTEKKLIDSKKIFLSKSVDAYTINPSKIHAFKFAQSSSKQQLDENFFKKKLVFVRLYN